MDSLQHSAQLQNVVEGKLPLIEELLTHFRGSVNIVALLTELVSDALNGIANKNKIRDYIIFRAILVPTNEMQQEINDSVCQTIAGLFQADLSADSVMCEFLNSQKAS